MMRFLRTAVVALGAVAVMGSAAAVQAADLPPAGTLTYAVTGSTPSPKDIVMHWEGTCTKPGKRHHLRVNVPGWGGSQDVQCEDDGTYRAAFMIYDYESRGLKRGHNFDYTGFLLGFSEEPATSSEFSGTATL
ncbi:hypothetical protein ACF1BE_04545 [Streptomyces sp. NPDC014991]|uniref:hypothetical protein n=1 Tax=Streptomyces sp. NPDC014991 TaxID=3364935 RepID=UPI0036F60682